LKSYRLNDSRLACVAVVCSLFLTACGGDNAPTNPSPAAPSAVTPAAVVVSELRIDASFVGGATVEGVVTLTAPAPSGGVVVALSADNTTVTVPASVTVGGGNASASFPVVTAVVTRTANVTVTARVGDTVKTTAVRLRIDPNGLRPTSGETISFWDMSTSRTPVTSYSESGFSVVPIEPNWISILGYGNPAPSLQFETPGGVTTVGRVRITNGGSPFWLTSVDLYSSVTPIPYVLEGLLSEQVMFTVDDGLPNTFGRFVKVTNPHLNVPIDTLIIRLTNPLANSSPTLPGNPMGIDNIVVRR
jgi:hypothetical protein